MWNFGNKAEWTNNGCNGYKNYCFSNSVNKNTLNIVMEYADLEVLEKDIFWGTFSLTHSPRKYCRKWEIFYTLAPMLWWSKTFSWWETVTRTWLTLVWSLQAGINRPTLSNTNDYLGYNVRHSSEWLYPNCIME